MPDKHQGYVGITYYAQKKLKGITKVAYSIVGTKVDQFESLGFVESPYLKLELISPVSGEITEINAEVQADLKKLNLDAETQYLLVLSVNDQKQLEGLLTDKEYQEFTKEE